MIELPQVDSASEVDLSAFDPGTHTTESKLLPETRFIESAFNVTNKKGITVPFRLNRAQRRVVATIAKVRNDGRPVRLLAPKARQGGISTLSLAMMGANTMIKRNHNSRIITDSKELSAELLKRTKEMIASNRVSAVTGEAFSLHRDNVNEILLKETNSWMRISSVKDSSPGRGNTLHELLCSEVAYWGNDEFLRTATDAVPYEGQIIYESTGNGMTGFFYDACISTAEAMTMGKEHTYQLLFIPWTDIPEYQIAMDPETAERFMKNLWEEQDGIAYDEPRLVREYGLTATQLAWRRWKIDEKKGNIDVFNEQFPLELLDCFRQAEGAYFKKVRFDKTQDWEEIEPGHWRLQGHPRQGLDYVMGVDPAAGVGQDRSVVEIICAQTRQQVYEVCSDRIGPKELALVVERLGAAFGALNGPSGVWPLVVVESNNHGILVLNDLLEHQRYPRQRIFRDDLTGQRSLHDYGFRTKKNTKPQMIGVLNSALYGGENEDQLIVHSPILAGELKLFTGDLEAPKGHHDDTVMAFGLANWGLTHLHRYGSMNASLGASSGKTKPSARIAYLPDENRDRRFGVRV